MPHPADEPVKALDAEHPDQEMGLYGLMAQFDSPEDILAAARKAREEGYTRMDAYSPFPVHGLAEELGFRVRWMPLVVLVGGIIGAVSGYAMQYYISVIDYPLNIGGRPLHSWPAFIPVTFETTILTAALFAVLGMLALNGLPMPYHPTFNARNFGLASRDRFFLCIEAADPKFDRNETWKFLDSLGAHDVCEVEN